MIGFSKTTKILIPALVAALFVSVTAQTSDAKPSRTQKGKKASTQAKASKPAPQMGREFVFDGSVIGGQYHSAGESVLTVEQDKPLSTLIGLRANFKDRLEVERSRLKMAESKGN